MKLELTRSELRDLLEPPPPPPPTVDYAMRVIGEASRRARQEDLGRLVAYMQAYLAKVAPIISPEQGEAPPPEPDPTDPEPKG